MMMHEIQEALRQRYSGLHPLIFRRSVERAKTNGELFDILDSCPNEYPIVWCEDNRRWVHTNDLLQNKNFVDRASQQ